MPDDPLGRAEVRRLMNWFNVKFFDEVSNWLVTEKIYKRFMPSDRGGGAPDMDAIRAARANVRYHLRYIGHLIGARNWLAGDRMSFADLAAAAHLSCIDYLGDVPWAEDETAKNWYARMKSRPSFRPLLGRPDARNDAGRSLRRSRLLERLRDQGAALGFDLCRIAAPDLSPKAGAYLARWIAAGAAWRYGLDGADAGAPRRSARAVERGSQRRHARRQLWAGGRSAGRRLSEKDRGVISVYARNRDYHDVIKGG